jgi:hypothetical protein
MSEINDKAPINLFDFENEKANRAYLTIPAVTIPEAISLITDRKVGGESNDNDQLYFILKRNMEWGVFGEQKKTQEGECLISLPAFIQWTKKQGITLPKELSALYLDEDPVLSFPEQTLVSHRDVIQVKNKLYIKNMESKPKQKRENTLHEKIRQVYEDSKDKSPRIIWKKLKQLVDEEDNDIIQEVDGWTKPGAKIFGISGAGMKKRTFQNVISKLKNCTNN